MSCFMCEVKLLLFLWTALSNIPETKALIKGTFKLLPAGRISQGLALEIGINFPRKDQGG